jgi:hypothetical protein
MDSVSNKELSDPACRALQLTILITRRSTCWLLSILKARPFYLPFVKIVHALTTSEFGCYNFVTENALRDDGDIQSAIK